MFIYMYFLPVEPFWTNLNEIFIQEIQLENVISKMAATPSRHQIQGNKRNPNRMPNYMKDTRQADVQQIQAKGTEMEFWFIWGYGRYI